MKTLKNMILENAKDIEMSRKVELILHCNIEQIRDVESDNSMDDYDSSEEFYSSNNRFYIDFDVEFELLNGKEQLGYLKCYLGTTFDAKDNDIKLNSKQTEIEFDGDKMIGFTADDISTLIINAMDKEDEIWSGLYDAFGCTGNEEPHELFYSYAFDTQLRNEIAEYYNSFCDNN